MKNKNTNNVDKTLDEKDVQLKEYTRQIKEIKRKSKEELQEEKRIQKENRLANNTVRKREKAKSKLPKTVFETIPYVADLKDGIFEIEKGVYSKTISFEDVNYQVASETTKDVIFGNWSLLLNSLKDNMPFVYTIVNRKIDEKTLLNSMCNNANDENLSDCSELVEDWNLMLKKQFEYGRNDIQKQRYFTFSKKAKNFKEAQTDLQTMENSITSQLKNIGSRSYTLSTEERLEFLHDFYRPNEVGKFKANWEWMFEQGLSSKDIIAPQYFNFDTYFPNGMKSYAGDYFVIDGIYYRCACIKGLPQTISDDILSKLTNFNFPMMFSVSGHPLANQKAIRYIEKQLSGMKKDILEIQRRGVSNGQDPDLLIPDDLKQRFEEAKQWLECLQSQNQRYFNVKFGFIYSAESLELLNQRWEEIQLRASECLCRAVIMKQMQEDIMNEILPLGHSLVDDRRSLLTETVAIFVPFVSKELFQPSGVYYSLNAQSKNIIMIDRKSLANGNGFILGETGKGKSFILKKIVAGEHFKYPKLHQFLIDPEDEMEDFIICLGGEVLPINLETANYFNPFDMLKGNIGTSALAEKTHLITSIIESWIGNIERDELGLIDRCVRKAYEPFFENPTDETIPTFVEFYDLVKAVGTESADKFANAIESYCIGSFNIFAHRTNVNIKNRLISFSLGKLKGHLRDAGLVVIQELIWNTLHQNRNNLDTSVIVDEFHTMFKSSISEEMAEQLFARIRKYGGRVTGVTQNVDKLLASEKGRGMVSNTQFTIMLSQSEINRRELESLFGLSKDQLEYIVETPPGVGLIRAGSAIIPFEDKFPKDLLVYKLMTTNPDELKLYQEEITAYKNNMISKKMKADRVVLEDII